MDRGGDEAVCFRSPTVGFTFAVSFRWDIINSLGAPVLGRQCSVRVRNECEKLAGTIWAPLPRAAAGLSAHSPPVLGANNLVTAEAPARPATPRKTPEWRFQWA